jgi:hypothetical protein
VPPPPVRGFYTGGVPLPSHVPTQHVAVASRNTTSTAADASVCSEGSCDAAQTNSSDSDVTTSGAFVCACVYMSVRRLHGRAAPMNATHNSLYSVFLDHPPPPHASRLWCSPCPYSAICPRHACTLPAPCPAGLAGGWQHRIRPPRHSHGRGEPGVIAAGEWHTRSDRVGTFVPTPVACAAYLLMQPCIA